MWHLQNMATSARTRNVRFHAMEKRLEYFFRNARTDMAMVARNAALYTTSSRTSAASCGSCLSTSDDESEDDSSDRLSHHALGVIIPSALFCSSVSPLVCLSLLLLLLLLLLKLGWSP